VVADEKAPWSQIIGIIEPSVSKRLPCSPDNEYWPTPAIKGAETVADEQKALTIVALTQTCGMCPSQWEGTTDDGKAVYIRYRHGELSVGVGKDQREAVASSMGLGDLKPFFYLEPDTDDPSGGVMSTAEMLAFTGFTFTGSAKAEVRYLQFMDSDELTKRADKP